MGPFSEQADDGDGGTGGFARAAGHGEDLVEGFAAAELDDAGGGDGAEDGDGLAAEFGDGDGDLRVLDVGFEAGGELGFELLDGEAGGFEAADEGEGDIAVDADEDGLITEVEALEGADEDLVVGAEDIAGGGGRGGWPGAAGRRRRPPPGRMRRRRFRKMRLGFS